MFPVPTFRVAQSFPLTVANAVPPAALARTLLLRKVVEVVVTPLVPSCVPVGRVKSTEPPPEARIRAPRVRTRGLAVAFALSTIADEPASAVRPLNRWLLVVLALPVRLSVPPPRVRAETLLAVLMMLVTGAVAAEKSRPSVPPLTNVPPV